MKTEELLPVLGSLERAGFETAEVFAKTSRSRHFAWSGTGEQVCFADEAGWAVRAGNRHGSFFLAAAGEPDPGFPWPAPAGTPLVLPAPVPPLPWSEPVETSSPLIGEREGLSFLRTLRQDLGEELPGARLLAARLDDGLAESHIVSQLGTSRTGVRASWRNRLAALAVDAVGPGGVTASLGLAEREARNLPARAVARRLANALAVAAGETLVERDRRELLLAPMVGARLLAGLAPLLVGAGARERAARFTGADGEIASLALTVVDNGRLPSGALAAPFDGEGMPTRETVLIERGRLRQTLVADGPGSRLELGCVRRPGWRDHPRAGTSHLFIQPAPRMSVATLLGRIERGYYFLDAPAPGSFDLAGDRFRLPVRGFLLDAGRATAAVAGVSLSGSISGLLHGVTAMARDLSFFPEDGMLGSPTLLLSGIEVVAG